MSALVAGTPHRLNGVVCLVTGAARGIGWAVAERLAMEGGRIACVDVSSTRLPQAAEKLAKQGCEVRGYIADVGLRDAMAATADAIERDFGAPLGVVVNNAVWARFQPLEDLSEETVDRTLAVGLKALIWTMQAAVPQMKRRGSGSVINISSTSALHSSPGSIIYAAMKAGVLGLTRAAAVELSPHRIRVNAVIPGMVGTPASRAQFDDATLEKRKTAIPLGRFGHPEDIAAAVAFLASDDSNYVQGAEIVVDGGWTVVSR